MFFPPSVDLGVVVVSLVKGVILMFWLFVEDFWSVGYIVSGLVDLLNVVSVVLVLVVSGTFVEKLIMVLDPQIEKSNIRGH